MSLKTCLIPECEQREKGISYYLLVGRSTWNPYEAVCASVHEISLNWAYHLGPSSLWPAWYLLGPIYFAAAGLRSFKIVAKMPYFFATRNSGWKRLLGNDSW